MNIETYLSYGKANAKSRTQLITETGLSDRMVRRQIEGARERGIAAIPNYKSGYFLAQTEEELNEFRSKEKAKAFKILKAIRRTYHTADQFGIASSWR